MTEIQILEIIEKISKVVENHQTQIEQLTDCVAELQRERLNEGS